MSRILFEFFGADEVKPSSIASGEAFGTATIVFVVQPTGIASAEAFGAASVVLVVQPSSILSAEVFGAVQLNQTLYFTGIASAEAFGTTTFGSFIIPLGIPSGESFGILSLQPAHIQSAPALFDGYLLRGAKTSPTNATTSAPADSGVARDVTAIDAALYPSGQPALVEARGDQYRSAVLLGSTQAEQEFLVWAANTGTLTTLEGAAWAVSDGVGRIPQGSIPVLDTTSPTGQSTDGSSRVIVTDDGGRDIAGVVSITVVRGDSPTVYTLTLVGGDFSFVAGSGALNLLPTANTLAATQPVSPSAPAFSTVRGDQVTAISYWVAAARFWWTRNDTYAHRFGWNGATSKWEPYRGSAPHLLGKLSSDGREYTLDPRPTASVGSLLPGSSLGDSYAMVRLGPSPDATSYPVASRTVGDYSGILVVPDTLANTAYNFASTSPPLAGVLGAGAGKIVWNPALIQTYEGLDVWYIPRTFTEKSSGVIGTVLDAQTTALYLAPVPGPGERPIVRLGNRQPLTVLPFDTEAALSAATVLEGEVGFALSTGRIKLSTADILKADPGTRAVPNSSFDKLYLGAIVRYDGVTLNLYPQPLKAPVLLVDGAGLPVSSYDPAQEVFIPNAETLPALGASGILQVPDGLGNPPVVGAVAPRPGNSGLIRKLSSGIGDAILFTDGRAVTKITTVSFEDELPTDAFRVPGDVAYVALEKRAGTGSLVMFGSVPRKQLTGKPVYFRQGEFVPSGYADSARLFSRLQDTFVLDGTEILKFRVGAVSVTWVASPLGAGTWTAAQVAANINTAITITGAPGSCYVLSGRLVIAHNDLVNGLVSIGFGTNGIWDLTGCRALGFIPGWVASPPGGDQSATDLNWLPDYGGELGFYRSPRDIDGSQGLPDYQDKYRVDERTLTENINPVPYQFLDFPPREDIAGYDEGVFFTLSAAGAPGIAPVADMPLLPWVDVQYRFEDKKFAWLASGGSTGQILSPVAGINLGAAGIVPDSLIAPLNGFVRVSEGGPLQYLEPDVDFLLPNSGGTGEATLINRVGELKLSGARGHFTAGTSTLTDTSISFAGVSVGDRLKVISGDALGSYLVSSVPNPTSLVVSPNFLVGDAGKNVSYEVYQGVAPGVVDEALVADVVFQDFNHLASEPFEIRVLTRLGTAGGSLAPANASKDIERGRPIFARISQVGIDLPLTLLTQSDLGVVANGSLSVPTVGARFTSGAFNLRIGTQEFTQGIELLPVAAFSPSPANIEYINTGINAGDLKFSAALLDEYQSATVLYVETLLPAADLLSGQAEIDPDSGSLSLSQIDLTAGSGSPVYFVSQLSTEGTTDVTANPILGSFTFLANPIQASQLVEAVYYRAVPNSGDLFLDADGNPVQMREFLPLYIRAEVATRISSQLYAFNPTGRTVDQIVDPVVYTGSRQQTYGAPSGCSIDFNRNTISINSEVSEATNVTISYAVYEAFGGETSYSVSLPPVWRPPFRIDKNQTQFLLDTNRTSDLLAGKVLRVGSFTTYVRSATYDVISDTTLVTVFPSSVYGAGSLNPGVNALSLLTDRTVAVTVDPFGVPVSVPGSDPGFLPTMAQAFTLASTPHFETVTKGQVEIKFDGDLTQYAVAGHLLELFGKPFAIVKSVFSQDGRVTTVSVSSPFPEDFVWSSGLLDTAARISVRPIYPEGATQFLGAGGFLSSEPYEVVLFGETDDSGNTLPGRTLVSGQDYNFLEGNGSLAFIQPHQAGFAAGQKLLFARTDVQQIGPKMSLGHVQYPRVSSSFLYVDPPSAQNGREGGVLQGTYTFESPDAFYVRAVPLLTYVGEVSLDIQKEATAQDPAKGPTYSSGASKLNSDYGRMGLVSESQNLVDRDRAARTFLGFYNAVVSSFEQIEETLNGAFVGERDGKLRLYVGKGDPWVPPGYEDEITGALNPRVLWFDAWMSARQGLPTIRLIATDPVTDPLNTTTDANGRPVGSFQDSSGFHALTDYQDILIKNDVDDVVLVTRNNVQRKIAGFIHFKVTATGLFSQLSEANPFSRLFPERTSGFTTLGPGLDGDETLGNPGVYSAGKFGLDPLGFLFGSSFSSRSTTGTVIGTLENPVLGTIQNILGVKARDRLARARIWSYSATGFPEVDVLSTGLPSFIATPLPLVDFPILSDTGLPDTSQLASQSITPLPTGFNDLLTGDPDLHTPPFASGAQLALGYPKGNATELGYADPTTIIPVGASFRYAGVFVDQILKGCVITLKSKNTAGADVPVTDPTLLLALTGAMSGDPVNPERGDTLFVVPGTGSVLPVTADPPTIAQLQSFTAALPGYRTGTDFNYTPRTGEITDATLPSFSDPTIFGLKEITGQRPPSPLSTIEAQISFQNGSRLPTRIPALDGDKTLDSGDYSLPYYGSTLNELELLGETATLITGFIRADSPDPAPVAVPQVLPYTTEAVFPDETLGDAGVVSTNSALLATLSTFEDLSRKTTSGAYPPPPGHAGVGDVEPYDLVLVQAPNTATPGPAGFPAGATGIHSIADISLGAPNQVDLPRFTTAVSEGTSLNYDIGNAIAWVDFPAYASGVVVKEDTNLVPTETTFDIVSVGAANIVLDDGLGGGLLPIPVGGLNDVFTLNGKGSQLIIKLINKATGQFVPGSIVTVEKDASGPNILACTFLVSGDGTAPTIPVAAGGFYFLPDKIVIKTTAPDVFFDFVPFDPVAVPPPGTQLTDGFHDFALSVHCLGSSTGSVGRDRLTFNDHIDFRSALPRGFTHPANIAGSLMECQLSTFRFESTVYNTVTALMTTRANFANDILAINAGVAFTFPARSWITPSVNGVGTFALGLGSLRALGFEGQGNVPIEATGITFTAIPSSRQDDLGPIYNSLMVVGEDLGAGAPFRFTNENGFLPLVTYEGDLSQIQSGDIAVVKGFVDPTLFPMVLDGSGKVGTYLIRAAVAPTVSTPGHQLDLTMTLGSTGDWMDFTFPQVVNFDPLGPDLTVTSLLPLQPLQDVTGGIIPASAAFPAAGRVYVILDATAVGLASSAVSAAYASLNLGGNTFVNLSGYQDGVGAAITLAQFQTAVTAGLFVSGMTVVPVSPYNDDVPVNLPGYTFWPIPVPGTEHYFGFRTVTATRTGSVTYDAAALNLVGVAPAPGQISAYSKVKVPSTSFIQLNEPVYDNIPGAMDLTEFNWAGIHGAGPACMLPGDIWDLEYHARHGIFIEPSFPVSGNDLGRVTANVVDATHTLTAPEVGSRDAAIYLLGGPPGGSYLEWAQVEVRRIRRFHPLLNELVSAFLRLRFVYEIRRGIVQTFTLFGNTGVLVAEPVDTQLVPSPLVGGTATQMGDFTDTDMGIRSGDQVRFLDSLGRVVSEADILVVETDGKTLTLSKNALTLVSPGTRFEVYLRTAPIPHEQSCAELLELATDRVLLDRKADLVTQDGGKVDYIADANQQTAYDQSINVLSDTDGGIDFTSLGILPGDILVIDPEGALRGPTGSPVPPEKGSRPFGDDGVLPRGGPVYVPGSPSRTDDNRGYYKVASVSPTEIGVVPLGGTLAGNRGTPDVIFDSAYAVYPTVHGSNLSGAGDGIEGQMDLRPTAFADVSNSFQSDWLSVAPFSYKVIRPSLFLTEETVELILSTRERMLSWIEELQGLFEANKSGTYFEFQRDEHISDLGDPSDPADGLGVLFDAYIAGLEGRVLVSPFANTSDCLSVLDRRFWGLDFRLDYLQPPFAPLDPPYSDFVNGVGRPVLPDRIEEALQQRDQLRDSRWAWLCNRVDRVTGTLEAIRRFEREIPRRRAEQERLLTMVKGTKTP